MRILHVLNDTFKKGGTESVVFNYYNRINKSRFQIDFMIHTTREEANSNSMYNNLLSRGVTIHLVTPRRISIRQNRDDINKVFKENHYDIVHSHADCANAFILSLAKKNGISNRIAHSHNTKIPIEISGYKSLFHVIYLEFCRYRLRHIATHFMACSDVSAKWLFGEKNYKKNNVYILHNAIELQKYRFDEEIRRRIREEMHLNDKFVIGHIGRFTKQKNHVFIINLVSEIINEIKDVQLILIGEGPEFEKIRKLSDKMNITQNIHFLGNVENVGEVLQAIDVYIFPSIFEGLPVSLIEAQASGLKCFVSDSENVSKEICITDLVTFLPLNRQELWKKNILDHKNTMHKDYAIQIRNAGYDIAYEIIKLEEFYSQLENVKNNEENKNY